MNILMIDCETTGLDPKTDRIVEIAVSLYDSEEKRLVRSACFLTGEKENLTPITEDTTKINGITPTALDKYAGDYLSVFSIIESNFLNKTDYFCAHNAPFDRGFIFSELERLSDFEVSEEWQKPWIDTAVDIPYPVQTRKLTHLAAEHGFLNPFPHTALSDVLTMYKIFIQYDLEEILKRQAMPNIQIRALVDYANREKASKRGYRWNPTEKKWLKNIKNGDIELEKNSDFEIEVMP